VARFIAGDVVVLPFPFTDLQSNKVRPALVVAAFTRGDILLCQLTSQASGHPVMVPIGGEDFMQGSLPAASQALPHRLVTAHDSCVRRHAGRITLTKLAEVRHAILKLILTD
jgi:mRNA interferase MazF